MEIAATKSDKPYEELHLFLNDILNSGGMFWGKFWCEKCGSRQTFEEPNILFRSGICEECNHETALDRWGLIVLLNRRIES